MKDISRDCADTLRLFKLAWPEVVETRGCLFLRDGLAGAHGWEGIKDRTGREAFVNHVHILDIFCGKERAASNRAARTEAWQIALTIAKIWAAKFGQEFPRSPFRVYATRDDEPVVRFHRCYPGEEPWLGSPGSIWDESGGILVLEIAAKEKTDTA